MRIDDSEGASLTESDKDAPHPVGRRLSRLDGQLRPVGLRLKLFLCGIGLLIAGLQAWSLHAAHAAQEAEAAVNTSNMTRALAAQAQFVLKIGDAALSEAVERVEHEAVAGPPGARSQARLAARFADIVRTNDEIQGLFVYGPHGEWRVTSLSRPVVANNADREYFQYHRTHPDRATRVGPPVRSRSSGVLVIPLSRRIDNPDGSFGGVALVTLNLSFFGGFYDRFDVGRFGTILLATDSGTLIYRRPFSEGVVGINVSEGPLLRTMRSTGPVGTRVLRARDGIERLYSFRHLDGFPLVVASALATDELFDGWRKEVAIASVVVLLTFALLAWGGKRLLRQIRVRDALERELRAATASLQRHNASLRTLADHDALTGLANRRMFEATLAHEYGRARRNGEPFSLIMVDVDFFKKYNDRYGHVAGDACLRRVAAALGAAARRPSDLAARYGGEEFAFILPDTGLAGAVEVAERVREAVAALGIEHADNGGGQVTVSLGVYAGHPKAALLDGPETWVEAADRQLYEAKSAGRNRVAARAA